MRSKRHSHQTETPRSTPGVRVRVATAADLPAIGRLGTLLVEVHHAFDEKRFLPASPRTAAGYASFLGAQLDEPDATILVAESDGAVIGYAYAAVAGYDWISLRGPAGILHDVLVDPAHRGHGVGRQLVEAALAHLGARGVPRVVLSTAELNVDAQRLFTELGFRRTMIEMTRELEDPAAG
jgi:ribosomal protein S18 acetylase RimI-like enzyme